MHRSHWACSAAILCSVCARLAHGGAHEQPRYVLEGKHLVVEHDGMRDVIDIECDEPFEMKHREGRLLFACGGSGIAIYGLDDPLHPNFIGRRKTRGGPCVGIAADDTCIVKSETIRMSIASRAPREVVRLTACGLTGTATIDGRIRTIDITVDGKRCARTPPPDPFFVVLRTEPIDDTELRVVLEHEPTDVVDDEIREAFAKIAEELESRIPKTWNVVRQHEQARKPTKPYWYGWQTIIIDASAAVSAATVFGIPIGILGYSFGPPIVHWVHGHVERGFFSLALRLGPPLLGLGVGTLIGFGVSCSEPAGCGGAGTTAAGAGGGMAAGAITGGIIAPIWDAIVAYDEPRPPVVPVVIPTERGAVLGLGGTF